MEQGRGTVVFYDERANYGFIEPDDGSADVVFTLRPGEGPVAIGDVVRYDLAPAPTVTPKGPEALSVRKVWAQPIVTV